MKCPKCEKILTDLASWVMNVEGQVVMMLTCPSCQTILGSVNKSGDSSQQNSSESPSKTRQIPPADTQSIENVETLLKEYFEDKVTNIP
jgi:hypothetical protein